MKNTTVKIDLACQELEEIKEGIRESVKQALILLKELKRNPEIAQGVQMPIERAAAYWVPHILCALDDEHGYLGGSVVTMQHTIDELRNLLNSSESEDGEEAEGES